MLTQFVHVEVSVTVPGFAKPIKNDHWIPIAIPEPRTDSGPLVYEIPKGDKYRPRRIKVGSMKLMVPAAVANLLIELATCRGSLRIRLETWRKLRDTLPEVAEQLERDPNKKVVNKAALYHVPKSLSENLRVQ